jgi:hypothetical protein
LYEAVDHCEHCGAKLSHEELQRPNCAYCGTVFKHQSMAAQHAAVVNQMLQQQGAGHVQVGSTYGAPPPSYPGAPPPMHGGVPGQTPGWQVAPHAQQHIQTANTMLRVSLIVGGVIAFFTLGVVALAIVFML